MCLWREPSQWDNPFRMRKVGKRFSCKVFLTLALQYGTAAPFTALVILVSDFHAAIKESWWIFYLGLALYLAMFLSIIYCGYFLRMQPYHYIVAAVMTSGLVLMGMSAASHSFEPVVVQLIATLSGIYAILAGLCLLPFTFSLLWLLPIAIALSMVCSVVLYVTWEHEVMPLLRMNAFLVVLMANNILNLRAILRGQHVRFVYKPREYFVAAIFLVTDSLVAILHELRLLTTIGGTDEDEDGRDSELIEEDLLAEVKPNERADKEETKG